MQLFKTAGSTYDSVLSHRSHAFVNRPVDWFSGEFALISKNKADCVPGEKQIQVAMRIRDIKRLAAGEAEALWPGNEGRWRYIVRFDLTVDLQRPFDLHEVLGDAFAKYRSVVTFAKILPSHESLILGYLGPEDAKSLRFVRR